MYSSRKRPAEEVPTEMTAIWSCTKEGCNGWIRDNYSFEDVPSCSQCHSPMLRSMKSLPILHDSSYALKTGAAKTNVKNEETK